MKKAHNGILAKMLAAFARDAEPEELEEAVDAIEDITSPDEPVAPPPAEEEVKDEEPDKMDMVLDKLDQLLSRGTSDCKDEDPEEDPIEKLEQDLDEVGKEPEVAVEEEETLVPDEDPDEMESHFVDPEQINEEDEDEVVEEEEEEEIPMADKRACDAARIALNAIKPVIASLPPSQRKIAADKAVAQIRKASGLDSKPSKNGYLALKKSRKAKDSSADVSEIGRRIMEKRNPNYKK